MLYIGHITILKSWRGLGMWMLTRTGPNNTRHVIWAISKFLFNIIIIYNNNTKCCLKFTLLF